MMNTPPEETTDTATGVLPAARATQPVWRKLPLYFLAVCGVLFIALLVYSYITSKSAIIKVTIDTDQTIDLVMTRNYGKYSLDQRGWLYVGEGNRTYLMRVVQMAKPADGPLGDELYFVASGTPLDGAPGAIYGLHLVRADATSHDGSIVEISAPYNVDGDLPLKPENVRFEALSDNLWAWVIKVQDGFDPKKTDVVVRNKVYAAHDQQIALLASFNASRKRVPEVSCEEANLLFQAWYDQQNAPLPRSSSAASSVASSAVANQVGSDDDDADDDELESEPPPRCQNASWTYRTAAVTDSSVVALTVTSKGVIDGSEVEERRWKLVFDPKSYTYIVPIELQVP